MTTELMHEDRWSEQNTTPSAIEAALRDMLRVRHAANEAYVPARVLNLVVVVDREWRGEIANRLEDVGRYNASRTVLCTVEAGRSTLDAHASMAYPDDPSPGQPAVLTEGVEIAIGPQHVAALDAIVDPVIVSELMTVVWAPHGHADAIDALDRLAHVVLLDSSEDFEIGEALARVSALAERAYVVDLSWLRSVPWRERVCASFDPPAERPSLAKISAVTVRHHPESGAAALMFLGWLASRLGWDPSRLVGRGDGMSGKLHARRQDVAVVLQSEPRQSVPGLAGVTIETADGGSIALDRGPGGLTAHRRLRDGRDSEWTVLGASRGEGGILGEGVRQALLRDPTYRPAVEAAKAMLP